MRRVHAGGSRLRKSGNALLERCSDLARQALGDRLLIRGHLRHDSIPQRGGSALLLLEVAEDGRRLACRVESRLLRNEVIDGLVQRVDQGLRGGGDGQPVRV